MEGQSRQKEYNISIDKEYNLLTVNSDKLSKQSQFNNKKSFNSTINKEANE